MGGRDQLRNLVIQLLQAMSQGENILQCIKEALILHQNFNPVILFESLSRERQKFTKADLVRFLEQQHVQFSEVEIREYMANNNFDREITFNKFLDSIIPFNADALRAYKDNYLAKLSINELDDEVEFIFRQLVDNQLKFARVLNEIKAQIVGNCKAGITKVSNLIKNDLIHKSKVREGRKFQQKFESMDNQISFMDLRRFLELWRPTHEVMLLNLMRFLRSDDPLKPINLKLHDTLKKSKSVRHLSASKVQSTEKKVQKERAEELNLLSRSRQKPDQARRDIYDQYKKQMQQQLHKQSNIDRTERQEKPQKAQDEQEIRKVRWKREKKGVDGSNMKKLLASIVTRQQRLQKLRKKLFQSKQFNLINLFKLVDRRGNGIVNAQDIRDFINKQYHSDINCSKIIDRFSRQSGILRFQQFCDIFRPLSKQLNQSVGSRNQNPIPNPFKNQTNRLIGQILRTTVEMQNELSSINQRINDMGQDVRDLFRWLDLQEKGYIDQNDIKLALQQDQFFCDSKDLKLLMRHFRKRIEDRVQLHDLRRLLEP